MEQLSNLLNLLGKMQRVLKMKDSVAVSIFSGLLGTLAMDISNLIFWKKGKTETLYGHIAGSIFVNPLRLNQRKNFWLGQAAHIVSGAVLAYPLNLILKRTGKDKLLLKGAFFGAVTWEIIYGLGRRFSVFSTKPHFTKTHYTELFNNIIYGVTTAQALVAFSDPSMFPNTQNKTTTAFDTQKNKIHPIYADVKASEESTVFM
jgi:riboflavin transporter FmnP